MARTFSRISARSCWLGMCLLDQPFDVEFGEGRPPPGEGFEYFLRVAGRRFVGLARRFCPGVRVLWAAAKAHRPLVPLGIGANFVHPDVEPLPLEIPVLIVPPKNAPAVAFGYSFLPAFHGPHFRVEVAGFRICETVALDPPGGYQKMGMDVNLALVRSVDVELDAKPLATKCSWANSSAMVIQS